MNQIWANRLVAGTKVWNDVPAARKDGVMMELAARVARDQLSAEKYAEITGVSYEA